MRRQTLFLVLTLLSVFCTMATTGRAAISIPEDKHAGVILAYHRIDEENYPGTNLRLEDFKAHLQEIEHSGYTIMPLPEMIHALKNKLPLPERALAITFEGGYQSAFKKAMPLLIQKRIPFTVFYASSHAENDYEQYMGWSDLRQLTRHNFINFGILPDIYARIRDFDETENKRLLNNAVLAYRKFFNKEPEFLSYPFGEYTQSYKKFIETQSFSAVFGLQSGVAYSDMDFMNVPRFTMTEGFGDIQRFRTVAAALPIPAFDIEPEHHVLRDSAPLFGFSVPQGEESLLKNIQCFISGQGAAIVNVIGQNRLEIRPQEPLDDERVRINCTQNTGTLDAPQWRWFGMLYSVEEPPLADIPAIDEGDAALEKNTDEALNMRQAEPLPPQE